MSLPDVFELRPPTTPEWATYVPHRHPQWKIHRRKGDASNALGMHFERGPCALYHFEDGEWIKQVETGPKQCSKCGIKRGEDYPEGTSYTIYGKERRPTKCWSISAPYPRNVPSYTTPLLCEVCRYS
jgi:hypothetical protein